MNKGFILACLLATFIGITAGRLIQTKLAAEKTQSELSARIAEADNRADSVAQDLTEATATIKRWQEVASEVLRSRGFPIVHPSPGDLWRLKLKSVEFLKPVIRGEKLEIEVKDLEMPPTPVRFDRDSKEKPFWADRLFFNVDIQSATLGNGKITLDKSPQAFWETLMPFISEVFHSELGTGNQN